MVKYLAVRNSKLPSQTNRFEGLYEIMLTYVTKKTVMAFWIGWSLNFKYLKEPYQFSGLLYFMIPNIQ